MFTRCISAFVILFIVVSPCRGDIIILKNGKKYRGEIDHRNTLQLNPLNVGKITMLLEKIGSRESKFVTFDACDVDKIILELFEAKQIIDLEDLRQQSSAKKDQKIQEGDNTQKSAPVEPSKKSVLSENDIPPKSEGAQADNAWRAEKKKGLALAGGGFLAISVGAVVGFGEDRHLTSVNYVFIGMGAALMSYGIFKLLQARSFPSKSIVQIGIDQKGTIGLSINKRF